MKNTLALVLMVFGLVGCAVEEDTRLICDCDYVVFTKIMKKEKCYSDKEDVNNKSLVFNERNKKFLWTGYNLPEKGLLVFEDDKISFQYQDDNQQIYKLFDRVNLTFKDSKSIRESHPYWINKQTFYQCRVVEGV